MIPTDIRATIAAALKNRRKEAQQSGQLADDDDVDHYALLVERYDTALAWLTAQPAQEQPGTDALAGAWPDLSHVPDGEDRFSQHPISGGDA